MSETTQKQKKAPNYKLRLAILRTCSFLCSIAPLVICLIAKWDKYTATPDKTVKLCLGGILVVVFIALKALDKLKISSTIVGYGAVFVLAYLLESLLDDLMLISGMALLGELLDVIFFKRSISICKENILVGKTADATSAQVEEVLKKYMGRV